jgi:hypothetical protein
MEDRVEAIIGKIDDAEVLTEEMLGILNRFTVLMSQHQNILNFHIAPRVTRQRLIKIAFVFQEDRKLHKIDIMADAAIKEWQDRASQFATKDRKALEQAFGELDSHLTLRSYIVGYSLTDADTAVWKTIRENHISHSFVKQGLLVNVSRWFKYIEETNPSLAPSLPVRAAKGPKGPAEEEKAKEEGGSFDIGLQEVQPGEVVITRFPPEPSYVPIRSSEHFYTPLTSSQWLPSHRTRQSCRDQ